MDFKKVEQYTSPCGLDCFNCGIFKSNITDEIEEQVAAQFGINPDETVCRGCRSEIRNFELRIISKKQFCFHRHNPITVE